MYDIRTDADRHEREKGIDDHFIPIRLPELSGLLVKEKSPPTEHIRGMGIGRGKKTFESYSIINLPGKVGKFRPVHFTAYIFFKTPPESCFLGGARRHRNDHFIILLFDSITDNECPGEKPECFYKTCEAFFGDIEPFLKVFCRHGGDPAPNLLIDIFSDRLAEFISDRYKPEGVYYPVMPEKKFEILVFFLIIHPLEAF